ncbi:hypothetical protein HAX54_017914 [Datura stramonium]|uniref:Uncharacterized protein n=1 Tax=Datura stramonium TaxID=4076 RepID=A0ABS8RJ80_DATST|nr:hypothetical protein [Datura stramonium]
MQLIKVSCLTGSSSFCWFSARGLTADPLSSSIERAGDGEGCLLEIRYGSGRNEKKTTVEEESDSEYVGNAHAFSAWSGRAARDLAVADACEESDAGGTYWGLLA